jgi:YHS domain-containing protein
MRVKYVLMLAAASVAIGLWGTARLVADEAKVKCPVKGVEFQPTATTASVMVNGQKLSFCCANCPKAFAASPEKYVANPGDCPMEKGHAATVTTGTRLVVNDNLYYFCCPSCPPEFVTSLASSAAKLRDPVTHKEFTVKADSPRTDLQGQIYLFESPASKAKFDPKTAVIYGK